jgi:YD repeat-containing protein
VVEGIERFRPELQARTFTQLVQRELLEQRERGVIGSRLAHIGLLARRVADHIILRNGQHAIRVGKVTLGQPQGLGVDVYGAGLLRITTRVSGGAQSPIERDADGLAVVKPPNAVFYGYDALDDLKSVTQSAPGQGSLSRTFTYDSLKRLATATNPESLQTAYTYDSSGNLLTKTDARGVTTTYTYDGLSRLRNKSYSGSGAASTPSVSYDYDLDLREQGDSVQNYPIGRLSRVSLGTGASTMTYTRYDPLGRVTVSRQDTAGTPYRFSYTYNDQSMDSETYPSLT